MQRAMLVYGTRRKPSRWRSSRSSNVIPVGIAGVVLTGQHRSMLEQVNLDFRADHNEIMQNGQIPRGITARSLKGVSRLIIAERPVRRGGPRHHVCNVRCSGRFSPASGLLIWRRPAIRDITRLTPEEIEPPTHQPARLAASGPDSASRLLRENADSSSIITTGDTVITPCSGPFVQNRPFSDPRLPVDRTTCDRFCGSGSPPVVMPGLIRRVGKLGGDFVATARKRHCASRTAIPWFATYLLPVLKNGRNIVVLRLYGADATVMG